MARVTAAVAVAVGSRSRQLLVDKDMEKALLVAPTTTTATTVNDSSPASRRLDARHG